MRTFAKYVLSICLLVLSGHGLLAGTHQESEHNSLTEHFAACAQDPTSVVNAPSPGSKKRYQRFHMVFCENEEDDESTAFKKQPFKYNYATATPFVLFGELQGTKKITSVYKFFSFTSPDQYLEFRAIRI